MCKKQGELFRTSRGKETVRKSKTISEGICSQVSVYEPQTKQAHHTDIFHVNVFMSKYEILTQKY